LEYVAAYERSLVTQGGGPGAADRLALVAEVAACYSAWRYGDRPADVAVLRARWQQVRRDQGHLSSLRAWARRS